MRDKRYLQLWYRFEKYNIYLTDSMYYEGECKFIRYDKHRFLKYPTIHCNKYFRGPDGNFTNIPVIRLPEMYLTRAILRFKRGDFEGAAKDLDAVRKRAWDEYIAGSPYQPLSAGEVTEELIDNERIKELGFEGDYWFYTIALGKPILPGDRGLDVPNRQIDPPYSNAFHPVPQRERDSWVCNE
ncbi:MAG: RagB/SusD family nutrient uptake outer membrane protein [Bacteroidales bacterium]|nr:RagB/SusD family nutrient uptake outer membrane protein [Bacteroidales bacterium]